MSSSRFVLTVGFERAKGEKNEISKTVVEYEAALHSKSLSEGYTVQGKFSLQH
jgi:hypothetical protein